MDPKFWHDRWSANQIGFHQKTVNALLTAHLSKLSLAPGSRVFVPLCGKSRDIGWLLSQGHAVAGAELSGLAIEQLFADLDIAPTRTQMGQLEHFSAPGLDIFVGDIFDLATVQLGPVDAIFDRAALVALPAPMRARYARHLTELTQTAPQLLITFDYDQAAMDGPPFSVPAQEVAQLYGDAYTIACQDQVPVEGGLKGHCPATEVAWTLTAKP